MSAAPIAHYLLELEAGDDAGASSASGWRAGKPSKAAKATIVEEAHAKGFESGKAAADAQLAGKLEAAGSALPQGAGRGARGMDARGGRAAGRAAARRACTISRRDWPMPRRASSSRFSAREMQRKAVADLVESLTVLQAQDKAAAISISGAADLLEALRTQSRRQARQCRLSPGRGLRRARDGRANGAGNACSAHGWRGSRRRWHERRRRRQVARAGHHPPPGELGRGRPPRRRVEDRLRRLHDGDDGVLPRHVADQLHRQEDADAGCHLLQSDAPDRQAAEPEGSRRARRERGKRQPPHRKAQRRRMATRRARKKVEDAQPGEVRSRGKPFQREKEERGAEEPDGVSALPPARARDRPGAAPSAIRSIPSIAPRSSQATRANGRICSAATPPRDCVQPPPPTVGAAPAGSRTGETRIAVPIDPRQQAPGEQWEAKASAAVECGCRAPSA